MKSKLDAMQTKLDEKEKSKSNDKKSRDYLTTKKGFSDMPNYDGKYEKYDDWRFKVTTFIEIEDNFKKLFEYIEELKEEPIETNMKQWEDDNKTGDLNIMNEQLYNFLCLNLKEEALTIVKNMKSNLLSGVVSWWKFKHECQDLTGQRIQALANSVYKPSRVKKYADVPVAMEKWELDSMMLLSITLLELSS